jgi:hypothetical protein
MKRNFTGWGVTIAGLILAGGGALAMWSGWDMILVERGWSLFIAGAVALSGGVVTIALGRVIATLGRLGSFAPATEGAGEGTHVAPPAAVAEPAPTPESAVPAGASVEAPVSRLEPAPVERPAFAPPREPPPPPLRPHPAFSRGGPPPLRGSLAEATYAAPDPEPKEVDRYTAGDATYVMLSDGSVEVRGPGGVRRYASLAELKAQTAARSS